MPNGHDIDIENIPYAFSKVQETAELPPDISGYAMYDMLYEGMSLGESIEGHWGWGEEEDPYYYEDIEASDPEALEKAMYQSQIMETTGTNPVLTPYGPALMDDEVQTMMDAYPGASAIMDDIDSYEDGWASYFDDTDRIIAASDGAFDDLVDVADTNALYTGNLDTVDTLYADIGKAVEADAQDRRLNIPALTMGLGGATTQGFSYEEIVDDVVNAAKGIGNWAYGLVEDFGESLISGVPTRSGQALTPSLRELADDNLWNRDIGNQIEEEGAAAFISAMPAMLAEGSITMEKAVAAVYHLEATGEYGSGNPVPEGLTSGMLLSLREMERQGTPAPDDPLIPRTSATDYGVAVGPQSTAQMDAMRRQALAARGLPLDEDIVPSIVARPTPTYEPLPLEPDERIPYPQLAAQWRPDLMGGGDPMDYGDPMEDGEPPYLLYPDEDVLGALPGEDMLDALPGEPRRDPDVDLERAMRIGELMQQGATEEGAEYIVDMGLEPNTMANSLALNYMIFQGLTPEEAWAKVEEHSLPPQPTDYGTPEEFEEAVGGVEEAVGGFEGGVPVEETGDPEAAWEQQRLGLAGKDFVKEKSQVELVMERYRLTEEEAEEFMATGLLPKQDYSDAYMTPDEQSLYQKFTEVFNRKPGSGSFGAQELLGTMYGDAELLYHLQVVPSTRDIDYGQWYGTGGDYKIGNKGMSDIRREQAKKIDQAHFSKYSEEFLKGNPYSDTFYKSVLDFKDSMYRFKGVAGGNLQNEAQKQRKALEGGELRDKNNRPITMRPGEDASDTFFHRQNFMDMADERAQSRLATLVALYNTPVGADRYMREKMKGDYQDMLGKWLSTNRSPEDFIQAFIQPKKNGSPKMGGWALD